MTQKVIDIIIVTYNRRNLLLKILERIKYQTITDINVIINDDGSSPREYINLDEYNFIAKYQKNKNDAYHRVLRFNEGIQWSVSENVILLDDDILPVNKNWIEAHLNNLKNYDVSRGIVRFSDNGGVAHGARTSWFCTANTGFKAEKLKSIQHPNNIGGFDINYDCHYGCEDHDLGECIKKLKFTRSGYIAETEGLHCGAYYKNGDRSDSVVKHNRDYFSKKWGYSYDKIDGRK